MRFVHPVGTTVVLIGLASAALADASMPQTLSAVELDRVTAGAIGGAAAAEASGFSSFFVLTATNADVLLSTDTDNPNPANAQASTAIAGGDALSATAFANEPRSATVDTGVAGDGFVVASKTIGGAVDSSLASFETEATFTLMTVVDPIRLRP
jgi:hypothetical protein